MRTTIIIFVFFFIATPVGKQTPDLLSFTQICLSQYDTSLLISLQGAIIKIGDEVFISEKRKCYFSLEDYMIFDEYKIDKTKITFNLDPDDGNILQVEFKVNEKIYYYRK